MKTGLFDLIYLVSFVLLSIVRAVGVNRASRAQGSKRRLPPLNLDTMLTLLQSLGLFFLPFIYLFSDWLDWANYPMPPLWGWLGAVLYLLGTWMLWRTHVDLGANWSDTIEVSAGHTLVTHGVYSRIRHPMYSAHLVLGLGQCLLLANWIAGPSLLLLQLPFYFYRIPREEERLLQHFGEQYYDYRQCTGRL